MCALEGITYKESRTINGNPYHESHMFRNGALAGTIILSPYSVCNKGLSEFVINKTLDMSNLNVSKKYNWIIKTIGFVADVAMLFGTAKLLDNLLTKYRMKQADEKPIKSNYLIA